MDTTSLEKSQLVIAKLIQKAAENGIQETMTEFSDLNLGAGFSGHFFPCIDWLEAEGIIRYADMVRAMDGSGIGHVQNLVLTSTGQALLGMSMSIAGKEQTVAETVEQVGSGKLDHSKLGSFLGGAIGGLIKSLGG